MYVVINSDILLLSAIIVIIRLMYSVGLPDRV